MATLRTGPALGREGRGGLAPRAMEEGGEGGGAGNIWNRCMGKQKNIWGMCHRDYLKEDYGFAEKKGVAIIEMWGKNTSKKSSRIESAYAHTKTCTYIYTYM